MLRLFSIILLFIVFSVNPLNAQKEEELLDLAVTAYNNADVPEAFQILNRALEKYPEYPRCYFMKALWEYKAGNNAEAEKAILKLESIKPDYNILQKKIAAEIYFQKKDYPNAKSYITDFLQGIGSPENKAFANQMIRNIAFLETQSEDLFEITYQTLGEGINTLENEYFPSTTADESTLYFTRKTRGFEDIWVAQHHGNQWTSAKKIDEPTIEGAQTYVSINSDMNDGAHSISPSGRHLLFTSCDRPNNVGGCDLYLATRKGNEWGKPKILPPNINTKSWETQPCIAADGRTIYFVSSSTGYGGGDLFVTQVQKDGGFSNPENLGDIINTSGNEDRPFIHPDGKTLYFTSDGHGGYGGKDLFFSKKINGKWSAPVNLGSKINSVGDEFAIFINALGTRAYIARENRDQGRQDQDIYSFELPEKYKPSKVIFVKGIITNAKTNLPIKANVKIQDLENQLTTTSMNSDEKNGDFLVTLVAENNYAFHVVKEGFGFYSAHMSFDKLGDPTVPKEVAIQLTPLESGTKFELKNVFFESGKYELKPTSTTELSYILDILTKNPNLKMKISGHTDNVGNEQQNKTLSENRAKTVVQYLIDKGISPERLSSEGFGSSKPISTNDTDEGKALNRRTEAEIL